MKKLLLLLVAVVSSLTVWAGEYTISFAKGTKDNNTTSSTTSNFISQCVDAGSGYINSVTTCDAVYPLNGSIKMAKAKGAGTLAFTLSESGKVNATSVIINAKGTKSDCTIEFNGTKKALTTSYADYTFDLKGELLNEIKLVAEKGCQIQVTSLKVVYGTGGSSAVAPTAITFNPANGSSITTSDKISISADQDCEIRYAIDEEATKTSIKYDGPFTLTKGTHTIYAIAFNSAGETQPASATYVVEQAVEPTTVTATIDFVKHHDWKYTAQNKNIDWESEAVDNVTYTFPTEGGIGDGTGTGTTYPTTGYSDGLRLYSSSSCYINVSAPAGYYFESVEFDNASIKVDGNELPTTKIYTFTGKTLSFKFNPTEKITLEKLIIKLAKLGPDKVATPTFSIPAGSVEVGKSVTISSATEGATALISVNDDILEETLPYTYTFNTKGEYKFTVVASKKDYTDSDEATATYTVVNPKVATPTFSVASGSTVEEGESVTINCATEGAKISGTVNDTAITDEELPYTYTFEKAGSYTIKVVASKTDFDNSDEATATYTVTKFAAPANPVFSVSDAQPTPSGTVVTISAEGATSLTVKTYGIDGYVAKTDVIKGNTATVTVDKMQRRFTAIANREANDKAAASEEVEAFYTIGNRTAAADTYTLVTSASELSNGMEFVLGVESWANSTGEVKAYNRVMIPSANTYYRIWKTTDATFVNNEMTGSTVEPMPLILESDGKGHWYIKTKNEIKFFDTALGKQDEHTGFGYLYDSSKLANIRDNSLSMSKDKKAYAEIEIDENGNAIIQFETIGSGDATMGGDYVIRYNCSDTQGFSMYDMVVHSQYPLPRIYAKKTAVAEDNGYKMSFHHTPYKANGSVQAKVVAATSHSNETVLNGTVNKDGTSYTFTTNEVKNLCGKFYVKIENEELGGHISEAVVDFSDCNNASCTTEDHSPFVHVGNKEEKKLVLAKHKDSVPLSTNPHGRLWLHTNPEVTVTLDPFRSIKMSLASDKVTGVDDITVDSADAEVEYYNLQGIRVANPEHGIYIRRQGNTATKVRL